MSGPTQLPESLPMALLRAREAVMAHFRPILRAHGLTEQQWRVIRALADQEQLQPTKLSELTLISMPSLSRVLRGMEAAGHIVRRDVPGDNRRRAATLSEAGRALFATIAPESERAYASITDRVGTECLGRLYGDLGAVIAMEREG